MSDGEVLVQVVPEVEAGREIGAAANLAEQLDRRLDDIRHAIESRAGAVAASLPGIPTAEGWELGEISASFGVALTAQAGALVTKMSAGATFDVTITFRRQ